jgi:hypothetical protein
MKLKTPTQLTMKNYMKTEQPNIKKKNKGILNVKTNYRIS